MTALVVLLCILAALLLLAQIRAGGMVEYSESGLLVRIRIGVLKFTVYPVKPKPEQEKKASKKPKQEQPETAEPQTKKGGTLALIRSLIPLAAEAAGRLLRKIRIDQLTLHLTWAAGGDPAAAAMGFGAANAAVGMIYPLLDHNFKIKKSDVGVAVDFEGDEPRLYLKAALSLTIGQGIAFAVIYGFKFISVWLRQRRSQSNSEKERGGMHE